MAADRDFPASSQAGSAQYLGLLMPAVCGALACQGPEVPIPSPHSKAVYVSDQPKQQLYFAAFKGRSEGSP